MRIQNLTTVKDGMLSGPMSPMIFAQEIAEQVEIRLCGISRVWWENERTLQYKDEHSGLDTLVIYEKYPDNDVLYLFLDTGVNGLPIAFCDKAGGEIIFTPVYLEDTRFIHPTDDEVKQVFDTIFEDMSLIVPKEEVAA